MSTDAQKEAALAEAKARQRELVMAMMTLTQKDDTFKDLAKDEQQKRAAQFIEAQKQEKVALSGGTGAAAPAAAAAAAASSASEAKPAKPKKEKKIEQPEPRASDDPNPYPMPLKGKVRQTWPEPTVAVKKMYNPQAFPIGEILSKVADASAASEEKRYLLNLAGQEQKLWDLRQAAEVHREVRYWASSWIRPGMRLLDIANKMEKKLDELVVVDGVKRRQAFPTGLNLNHIAAHYTSNSDCRMVLGENDTMKIDYGVVIGGGIIDSAWTWVQGPHSQWDPLVQSTKAATAVGIKNAGVDARLGELGGLIEEVIQSYECDLGNGKTAKVKPIANLSGHNISTFVADCGPHAGVTQGIIHGGKSVPLVKSPDNRDRMEEGEVFAVETFASTGKGKIYEDLECSHYMAAPGAAAPSRTQALRSDSAKQLMKQVDQFFGTHAWCRKWLDQRGVTKHVLPLKQLCDAGLVTAYPPLVDVKGCQTSQEEHTIFIGRSAVEILSKGDDF